jgi:hypothetical protein
MKAGKNLDGTNNTLAYFGHDNGDEEKTLYMNKLSISFTTTSTLLPMFNIQKADYRTQLLFTKLLTMLFRS